MTKKEVVRFGPLGPFIANGVRRGDEIYLSGQVSLDDDGKVVGAGDTVAQVKQAYSHVKEVLGRFGATMDDIVDETWFLTDIAGVMSNIEEVWKARDEAYGGQPQTTQTMIQVSALAYPELVIEIKCIAHL